MVCQRKERGGAWVGLIRACEDGFPQAVEDVAGACFVETATIGLRWHAAERLELTRRAREAGGIRVKVIDRPPGVLTAKAEIDDLGSAEGGHEGRETTRRRAEEAVLNTEKEDEP